MMSCANYDYIEIVCLFNYPVEITLKSGEVITGKAIDTAKNHQGEECIKLKIEHDDLLVVLDSMAKLTIVVDNPHFKEVLFD